MTVPDRKILILDTTLAVIAGAGLDGLTHRAVDAAAGLPAGSTSYHFPKKAALLAATADRLEALLGKDCDDLQVGFSERVAAQGMDAAIDYVGVELVAYADRERDLFLARMELTLAAARRPELEGAGERLTAAAQRPIAFFLDLMAGRRADAPVEVCAGLIDGITLRYVTGQGPRPTAEQVRAVFAALL